eukprot:g4494.t1
MAESLDRMAKDNGYDVCYWSFQALPRPYNIDDVSPHSAAWLGQARTIHALGSMANERFAARYSPPASGGTSGFYGGFTGYGTEVNAALCAAGDLAGDRCVPAVLQSNVPTPYAVAIFRFTGANLVTVQEQIKDWRESESGHLPQERLTFGNNAPYGPMAQDDGNQWGGDGSLTAKVMPCSDIPDFLSNKTYTPDGLINGTFNVIDLAITEWLQKDNMCTTYDMGCGCGCGSLSIGGIIGIVLGSIAAVVVVVFAGVTIASCSKNTADGSVVRCSSQLGVATETPRRGSRV